MALGASLAGSAKVVLTADTSQFDRGMHEAQSRFHRQVNEIEHDSGRMGRGVLAGSGAFSHLGRSIAFASGAFLGAAGFTAVVRQSIGAASDLHEQINKADVVFRDSAKAVQQWSITTDKSLGIARGQALAFAATFGNLLVPMGLTRGAAATMSTSLVKLAADMASFNNASPEDVLRALQSGLAGQVRPLREYGVFLDQTRIKAEALRLGLLRGAVDQRKVAEAATALDIAQAKLTATQAKYGAGTTQVATATLAMQKAHDALAKATAGSTGALTAAQKAQATYSIILKDTKDAQGDFSRTSGGLANQTRILHAEITNLEEGIGKTLLPTVLRMVRHLTDWLGNSRNAERVQRDLKETVSVLTGVVQTAANVFKALSGAVGGAKNAMWLLVGAFVTFKGTMAALSFVSTLKNIGLIGGAAATASGEVKGLQAALLLLGSPAVLAALALGGAAFLAYSIYKDAKATQSFSVPGSSNQHVELKDGVYTLVTHTAGRGASAFKRRVVTQQQASALTGGATATPTQTQTTVTATGPGGAASAQGGGFIPQGASYVEKRSDQGRDLQTNPGTNILAPGDGYCIRNGYDPKGFGVKYPIVKFTTGRYANDPPIYIGHCVSLLQPNEKFREGQPIATTSTSGINAPPGWAEIGYAPGGQPGGFGQRTPFGTGSGRTDTTTTTGAAATTATIATTTPLTVGTTPPAYDPIPKRLQVALARAQALTPKNTADDLAALQAQQHALRAAGAPKGADDQITYFQALRSVYDQIASLTKTRGAELLPLNLQQALAAAGTTKGASDDLKALDNAIAFVERRLNTAGVAAKSRIKLNKLLKQLEDQRNKLAAPIIEAGLSKTLPRLPSLTATTREIGDLQAGRGTTAVTIPGIGKILTAFSLTPTVGAWNKIIAELKKKYAAANKRLTALKRSLAKAKRARFPNKTLIGWLNGQITGLKTLMGTIRADLGTAIAEVSQLVKDQADKAQQDAGEADKTAEAGAANIPTDIQQALADAELSGDTGAQMAALKREEAFLQNELATGTVTTADGRTIPLTAEARLAVTQQLASVRGQEANLAGTPADPNAMPIALQLQLARAQGTAGTADDLAALQAQKGFVSGRLAAVTDPAALLSLTNELNTIQGQIDQVINNQGVQIDQQAQFQEFFTGLRGLRGFESNILGSAIGGSTIQVTNYFATGPDDPHTFSAGVSFELTALMG